MNNKSITYYIFFNISSIVLFTFVNLTFTKTISINTDIVSSKENNICYAEEIDREKIIAFYKEFLFLSSSKDFKFNNFNTQGVYHYIVIIHKNLVSLIDNKLHCTFFSIKLFILFKKLCFYNIIP
ncbi:hypothetical protein UJ101_01852 [Flavobacteriaceae bacterium UJ101]|nr:hypothetical protein UJ101_01852 [Flavobacteriaceae bacterium UJ101]